MADPLTQATVTDHVGDHQIVATAEKTGDRTADGYGWWIGRFCIRAEGSPRSGDRVPGHYLSAEAALDAALAEARRRIEGGFHPGRPVMPGGREIAT